MPEIHSANLSKPERIRVLLVDDHQIVRQGLRSILVAQTDIEVVGEAENGQEGLNQAAQLNPDVVIMDLDMPVMNGLEAIYLLNERQPEIKIIGLSMFANPSMELKKGKVNKFLNKGGSADELITSIRSCFT